MNIFKRFKSLFPDLGENKITQSEQQFDEMITVYDNTKVDTGHGITTEPKEIEKNGQRR